MASMIFSDKEKILDEYHKQTGNREELVDAAISKTQSFTGWRGYSKEQSIGLKHAHKALSFLKQLVIWFMC
jgi:hypothetical protein